jgi:hypothetical protein
MNKYFFAAIVATVLNMGCSGEQNSIYGVWHEDIDFQAFPFTGHTGIFQYYDVKFTCDSFFMTIKVVSDVVLVLKIEPDSFYNCSDEYLHLNNAPFDHLEYAKGIYSVSGSAISLSGVKTDDNWIEKTTGCFTGNYHNEFELSFQSGKLILDQRSYSKVEDHTCRTGE